VATDVRARLSSLSSRYGLPSAATGQLAVLVDRLARPGAPTSVHDPDQTVDVHVADSLVGLAVPEMRSASLIADLGSGAGLPGLVLAAALPDAQVTLVESVGRKGDFLAETVAAMAVENISVVRARAEEWSDGIGRCDVVTARALAALPVLFEYAAPLLRADGVLVSWKGAVSAAERADGNAAARVLGLTVEKERPVTPFRGSQRRTLHVARKTAPTPDRFPRRPGIATKRPLSATNPP
jgi:16S rRNA (guanine527-N7)-methyltransferase